MLITPEPLLRQVAPFDLQIDPLVYELCGLTEEEIALVEGAGERREAEEPVEGQPEE